MTSRPKRPPTGDEEATAILRLGEFQGVPALNLSEARTIINAVVTRRRNIKQKVSESETLMKTQEYLELFARFKQQEHVTAVEQLLTTRTELERFERSQLGEYIRLLSLLARHHCPSRSLATLLHHVTLTRSFRQPVPRHC